MMFNKRRLWIVAITYFDDWTSYDYKTKYFEVFAKNKKSAIDIAISIALEGTGKGDGIGLRGIQAAVAFEK